MYNIFFVGVLATIQDVVFQTKTLLGNILRRITYIIIGIVVIYNVDSGFLKMGISELVVSIAIGILFLSIHLVIARGIRLSRADVNKGLLKTSVLIYGIELPAEEFFYRGIVMIPLCSITNNIIGILVSSLIFMALHIKSWKDRRIWIASFILALVCGITVINTHSIWSAIIIHNLNDFGFLTLVNKRNIFN